MKSLKIAVIGAGSTYTPELINGFVTRKNQIRLSSLALMDINRGKLEIVSGLIRRILKANEMRPEIIITESLEEAIEGANYLICQVRVGGLDARIRDEKIPLKYCLLGQETTGAGGFMKALRTIPVIMNVAKTMERLAPKAWLINFSNPSGIIAEAVLNHTGVKMLGLCNAPIHMIKNVRKLFGGDAKDFDFEFVGLNHLCWITAVYVNDKELLQAHLKEWIQTGELKKILGTDYELPLMKAVKGIPVGYLNYYYFRDEQLKKCMEAPKTRGEICKDIEDKLLQMYKDPELKEKPTLLDERGGALYSEAAVSLIDAIENDKNDIHVLDIKNNGTYDFMDKNDVIEAKCIVGKNGAVPVKLRNFDNYYIIGLMRAVKAYEKLTVKAALEGNYETALAALMVHPLIGDYNRAKGVLDDMLEANREYLPQFERHL
ncbi:MAG: 6-phospho-beta-glucosidase [Firmicutes bacterium]|nr:6-phospho-beta-glucosidase [Bacillota bacterium]